MLICYHILEEFAIGSICCLKVCLPTWVSMTGASCSAAGRTLTAIFDLEGCKTACLMDYNCAGIRWTSSTKQCIEHTNANDFNTLTIPAAMDLYVLKRCSPCAGDALFSGVSTDIWNKARANCPIMSVG